MKPQQKRFAPVEIMIVNTLASLMERPRGITEIVYDRLYLAITEHQFDPGSPLTEQGLAEQLQVSKTPVREALLRLRQMGLIEPDGKRGMRVIKLTPDSLRDTIEVREAMEVYCASRAAERITRSAGVTLVKAAQDSLKYAEAGDSIGFHRRDREFHAVIARAVGNSLMEQRINQAVSIVRTAVRRKTIASGKEMIACGASHVRIAEAICAGDAETAGREMSAHIRHVHEIIVATQVNL